MKKMFRFLAIMMVFVLILSGCGRKSDTGETGKSTVTTAPASKTPSSAGTPETNSSAATGSPADSIDSEPAADTGYGLTKEEAMPYAPDSTLALFDMKASGSSAYGDFDSRGYAEGSYSWDTGSIGIATTDGFIGEMSGSDYDMGDDEGWTDPIVPIDPIIDPEPPVFIQPRAGLLTAGEWNDNKNFDFLKKLISNGQNPEENFGQYFRDWGILPFSRLVIRATGDNMPAVVNAEVTVSDAFGNTLSRCRTNNEGIAYAYYNMSPSVVSGAAAVPATVTVYCSGSSYTHDIQASELDDQNIIEINCGSGAAIHPALDLMFVTDTTGSMMDELEYLQKELEDVITRVKDQNPNLSLRLSVNFYRDLEDEYVVRSHPFSTDINEELGYLKIEYADGGGDFEEAVEMALEDAVNNHDWREDSIKLMFMILDAPPHNTQEIRSSLASTLETAAAMGIRVIPIASSGINKSTEFFLRTFAMVTGGTYTFLTDDSGIGGSHLTPTVGDYEVEQLNEMIIRLINENLKIAVY